MNEVFNLGITFYQLLGLLAAITAVTIAVKITLSFDLNRYMESKKDQGILKLKNACTHHQVIKEGDEYGLQSLFISPPGTLQWQCQRCGIAKFFADGELERQTAYYLSNFEEFTKQEKKFRKLLKKNGLM